MAITAAESILQTEVSNNLVIFSAVGKQRLNHNNKSSLLSIYITSNTTPRAYFKTLTVRGLKYSEVCLNRIIRTFYKPDGVGWLAQK